MVALNKKVLWLCVLRWENARENALEALLVLETRSVVRFAEVVEQVARVHVCRGGEGVHDEAKRAPQKRVVDLLDRVEKERAPRGKVVRLEIGKLLPAEAKAACQC